MTNEEIDKQAEEAALAGIIAGSKGTGVIKSSNSISTLRSARMARQVTLRELASLTGISFPALSEIERGVKMPTPEQEEELELFFNARLRYRLIPFMEKPTEKE